MCVGASEISVEETEAPEPEVLEVACRWQQRHAQGSSTESHSLSLPAGDPGEGRDVQE